MLGAVLLVYLAEGQWSEGFDYRLREQHAGALVLVLLVMHDAGNGCG